MLASKITKRSTDYKSKEDVVPVLSREFNLLVDDVLAAEESSDISLKANIAAPTFTGTVTIPATGLTFTSNGVLVKAGAHSVTLTSTAATNVTLPTTGTLVTLAGAETLSGKTLTEPKFADLGFIADPTGAKILSFNATTTPVNYFEVSNAPTANTLSIAAMGSDTNISISYNTKGNGVHRFQEQSATGDVIAIAPQVGGAGSFTGTITSSDLTADITWTFPASAGTVALTTSDGHKDGQVFMVNSFNCPAPGTDWTPDITGVTLGASLSAKKFWIPLNFLKIGDEIVSYNIVGDATEAAAITLDCKLVKVNKANPLTTTDVTGGGITQVDADGNFDSLATLSAVETVATDKMYLLEVLGTTGAGDTITVIGAEITVNRK